MTTLTKIRAAFANSPEPLRDTLLVGAGMVCVGVFSVLALAAGQ